MTNAEIKKITNSKKMTHFYIRKGPFYRPNGCGYTDFITDAGVYTKEEAINSATHCRDIDLIPIDILAHNKRIVDKIKELATRII